MLFAYYRLSCHNRASLKLGFLLMKQSNQWQFALANVITNQSELFKELELDASHVSTDFPLRVPRGFVARMEKGNLNDPLLTQILPQQAELVAMPGYCHDPLQESRFNPVPGLLHKYHGRVLLVTASGCAINCRYCFRRHFAYDEQLLDQKNLERILHYIANDQTITEVIYSGGDPLLAKDTQLKKLTEKIAAISHVKRLRIHTRLPIVIPERINQEFINWFTATRLQPVMVVHCNHANEIDQHVKKAIAELRSAQVAVFNQAVLLKRVNDTAAALINLSEKLFAAGIMPYYLHLLDQVQGAAHFAVAEPTAKQLIKEVMKYLPGYLVPKLVKEQPDCDSKLPL